MLLNSDLEWRNPFRILIKKKLIWTLYQIIKMLWFRILPKLLGHFNFSLKVANKIHFGNNSLNQLSNLKINFPFFEQIKITVQQFEEAKVHCFVFLVSSWFSRSAKLWETAISSTPTLTNEALHTYDEKKRDAGSDILDGGFLNFLALNIPVN